MRKHKRKLIDICNIQYGYAFDSKQFTDEPTDMPLIRIRDVKRGYSDTYYSGDYNEVYIVNAGDILIGMDGEFNIAKWKSPKALLNQRVCKLIGNENVVEDYLVYYLRGVLKEIEAKTSFATVKHLSAKVLNTIELTIHEINEQTKIANILNNAKQIIDNRQKQLVELDDLIKSRFVEMFGDEHNSKNWDITNIGDVADIRVGVVIKPAQYYTDEHSGVRAFRSLNVGEMKVNDRDWVYFNKEGNEKNNRSILKENDVLIVRSGAPGKSCVVTKEYEGYNAIDVIIAHADESKVNPYYLSCFTNFPHGKKQIVEGTGGAAQQHFNIGKYKVLKLMLPPIDLQNEYCRFLGHVDKLKVEVQKSLDESQVLFDSLMQEYFE